MVKFSTALVFLICLTIVNGLAQDRYAVHYKYKPDAALSLEQAEGLLSPKVLKEELG